MVCSQRNWAALKFRSRKTTFFLFFAKIRCTQLYSTKYMFLFVCRKIKIQPYWTEKGFLPVCSESLLVSLDFNQNNVFVCFRTLNAQYRYEKKGKGCSGKHNTENSVTSPKINGNACFEKNQVKIKVTRCKLAENIFPVQYRRKQPNFTANKP